MAHKRMLAPINSIKHFVARTNTDIVSGAVVNLVIATAVAAPASAATNEVVEGSIIKAISPEMWLANSGSTNGSTQVTAIIEKIPAQAALPTVTNLLNLQAYPNKKNIFYTFQGVLMSAIDGNGQLAISRGWLLIPKGKQRMGLGDRLVMSITPVSRNCRSCGMFIYKEYR